MKCIICKKTLENRMQKGVCSLECAIAYSKTKQCQNEAKKMQKEKDKKQKEQLETSSELKAKIKQIVQKQARERDVVKPCISCNRYSADEWHGGHYFPAGTHSGVMFDLRNIHKQCNYCNIHLHGNQINYREGLIRRYGLNYVLELEEYAIRTKRKKWHRIELVEILNELKK